MKLFKITLPYDLKLTADQLEHVQEENSEFRFKNREEIGPNVYSGDTDVEVAEKQVKKDIAWGKV